MRGIKNYTLKEWLRFDPPIWYLKEKRNDAVNRRFVRDRPDTLQPFLEANKNLAGKNIAIVIAFNSPWIIEILIPAMKRFVLDAKVIICDNSNDLDLQKEIEAVCSKENTPYIALPNNPEKHPCRSHGIALNWVYSNIIQNLKPNMFACIDHDLIPFREICLEDYIEDYTVYGVHMTSPWAWSLWAGYSMYKFDAIKDRAVNFNNDRPSLLDTGGRNWNSLYRHLKETEVKFSTGGTFIIRHPDEIQEIEGGIIENSWLHLSGVGQRKERTDGFSHKAKFYDAVFDEVKKGRPLTDFIHLPDKQ